MNKTLRKPFGIKYLENPATIGKKMRNRRLELGLLQKDIGKMIGVTEDCITNWENNRTLPQRRFALKLKLLLSNSPPKSN